MDGGRRLTRLLTGPSSRAGRPAASPSDDGESRRPRRGVRAGAFAAVVALVMLSPSPALAAPFGGSGCTSPPTPEAPGQGLSGFFLPTPDPLPKDEDPFAQGAKTSAFEQYGMAGLSWYAYDLGCAGTLRDPSGSVSTWAARTLFLPAKSGIAALVSVSSAALHPTFLSAFDPLLEDLTDALHKAIFSPLAPLAVMLTGLLLLARSTRQRVSESTTAVAWAVFVMILAAALFSYPKQAGTAADNAMSGAVGLVSSGMTNSDEPPGDQVANEMYGSFLYRMWLTGEFCDPDSQAAQKYGGDILRAQALSWEQAKEARENGSASFVATRQQAFAETAQKVKDEDPIAYECLAGHGSSSLEAAILADLGMLLMAPFLLIAGLILIAAYVVIRFAVILAPALLTAAAFFPLRGVALAAARIVGAAIINGVLFMVCALFVIRVDTTILDPATSLPNWLKLILLGVVTVVMWYLTRPFRKLTTMISPHSFADSLNEAGLGFRRAGALFRRRQQEEEAAAREADEQTVGDPRRADHSDGRVREESRGPVTMMKVSAQRLTPPGLSGASPPTGQPGLPGAATRGALPPARVEGTSYARSLGSGGGRPGSQAAVPRDRDPQYVEQSVVVDRGGHLDTPDMRRDEAEHVPRQRHDPQAREEMAVAARQEESARARYIAPPGAGASDGLFDPGAPPRPLPEDDPRAYMRQARPEIIDGEEVYRLYDPADDPLFTESGRWSR